jgi:hypothetical protein
MCYNSNVITLYYCRCDYQNFKILRFSGATIHFIPRQQGGLEIIKQVSTLKPEAAIINK